jgi:protein tyrosine/serine phosphatase
VKAASSLPWDGCVNARHLGEVALADGQVAPAALVRSDSVSSLGPNGWRALVDHGIRTIVDLRATDETQRDPVRAPAGVAYRHVPIIDVIGPEETSLPASLRWDEAYREMLSRFRPGFAAAVTAVAEAEPGGVLVQCRLGRDRTGIVIALLLLLAGATDDAVSADYALSRARLEGTFDELIATESDRERRRVYEWHRAQPDDLIRTVLADLEETYGGVESYLVAGGAPADIGERITARLLNPGALDPSAEPGR